jgi:hypothetical protein
MQQGKIFSKIFFSKFAFYGLDTYEAGTETVTCQKSEPELFKSRNRNRKTLVTVPQHWFKRHQWVGFSRTCVLVSCDIERGGGGPAQGQQGGEQGGRQVHLAPSSNISLFATNIRPPI